MLSRREPPSPTTKFLGGMNTELDPEAVAERLEYGVMGLVDSGADGISIAPRIADRTQTSVSTPLPVSVITSSLTLGRYPVRERHLDAYAIVDQGSAEPPGKLLLDECPCDHSSDT
jgi:hypothetical protein